MTGPGHTGRQRGTEAQRLSEVTSAHRNTPFGASLGAQLVRICLQCGRPGFDPWVGKIPWRRERLPAPVFWPGDVHRLYSPWGHGVGHA